MPAFLALLNLALPPTVTQAADAAPSAPCLTLGDLRFGEKTYVRRQTESSDAGYAAEYYPGQERPQSWNARLELRSYQGAAGHTPVEVAAGVVTLERSGNPALNAAPVALNAEQSVVLLDYVTWSEATLHAGYVEVDVFKFFAAGGDARLVLGYRFVRKLSIVGRGPTALVDEVRIQRAVAVRAMLQLPLCAWTVSAPASSA